VNDDLQITPEIAAEMVAHCEEGRPNEACGVLARRGTEIVKVHRMRNAAASPVRYTLDPKEQFRVYRTIEDEGLELGGVYHSHTRTAAYPSPTDVKRASEDVPYLIVSLAGKKPSIRAFRILKGNWTDEEGEIVEIPVKVE
jgi:proteasome lid subunit RPN8/RPN11